MILVKTIDTTDNTVAIKITCNNARELNEVKTLSNVVVVNPGISVRSDQGVTFVRAEYSLETACVIDLLYAALEASCRSRMDGNAPKYTEHASNV